ncbi:MAG TPA: GAF domain-containing protein, partial [Anaerolineales bacterium]|nr:GAF domain-containing protein [Anaerolineales bacterium]
AAEVLRHQNEYLAALHETALLLLNRFELMPLLDFIVARAGTLLDTPHGYIDIALPDGSALEQKVGRGVFSQWVGERLQIGRGLGGRIWQTGQPIAVDDYATWPDHSEFFVTTSFHALLGVPLKSGDRVLGVLGLAYGGSERKFDASQIELLSRFADLASLAIDNARLYTAAQDELAERKRAEAALQRERDFAVQIMNTLGQGVTVTRGDGILEFVNPAYAHLIGFEPVEVIGKKTSDITAVDDVELLEYQRDRRQGGETTSYELRLRHKDGYDVPVLITGTPRYEDGHVIGAITVITDLTEQKQNEAVRDAIYLIAQATTLTQSLSDLFPAVHEIIRTIMPARNFYIALYDEKNDLLNFPYYADEYDAPAPPVRPGTGFTEHVLRTGKSLLADQKTQAQIEATGEAKMVGTRPVVWLGVPLSVEQKTIGVMVVQDYSAPSYGEREQSLLEFVSSEIAGAINRKRSEESLRKSEERFRALTENIPGVIFQCRNDDRYTFLYLNDAIEDLTGYPKEEFLENGLSFFDLYHPDDIEWMPLPSRQPDANTTSYQIIYRIRHKSGAWRWVEEWGTAIHSDGLRPTLLEGFMTDVTKRKWAEDMLGRNARELAALDHMGKAVAGTLDLSDVLKKVIDEVSPLLQAEGISILLPEGDHTLVFAAASGPASAGLIGHRIPLMAGTAGSVMKSGQSALIASSEDESQLYREVETVSNFHTQSLLAVPLALGGEVIGVMEAVDTRPNAFTLEDQRLLEAAATWAAIAIGNARQHERLQRRLQEGEAIAAISRALNQTLELPVIL